MTRYLRQQMCIFEDFLDLSHNPCMIESMKLPVYTLDQLMTELSRYGEDIEIREVGRFMLGVGRDFELWKDGVKRATWSSYLKETPPLDGKTPRGPSEYYDLKHL